MEQSLENLNAASTVIQLLTTFLGSLTIPSVAYTKWSTSTHLISSSGLRNEQRMDDQIYRRIKSSRFNFGNLPALVALSHGFGCQIESLWDTKFTPHVAICLLELALYMGRDWHVSKLPPHISAVSGLALFLAAIKGDLELFRRLMSLDIYGGVDIEIAIDTHLNPLPKEMPFFDLQLLEDSTAWNVRYYLPTLGSGGDFHQSVIG